MHALLFTLGTRGDVQPYVALGAALRARGHDVTIVTGRGFDGLIEAAGLRAATLGVDIRAILARPETGDAMTNPLAMLEMLKEYWPLMRQLPEEMWAIARDAAADVIVFHPKASVCQLIGQRLGIPALASALQPIYTTPTAAFPMLLCPWNLGAVGNRLSHVAFNALATFTQNQSNDGLRRAALHVGRPRLYGGFSPAGAPPRLHGYSRHLLPKPAEWGEHEHVTGYWFGEPHAWSPPPALARFLAAGPPPVYVGFGSMPTRAPAERTRLVIAALQRAGRRGVLATGWGGLADIEAPDTIFMLEEAPHDGLFPRCAAVVHHGGAGSTHEGLRWGRPTVVCPFGVDQPLWGRLVAASGAGPAPVPQSRLTSKRLAEAINAALSPEVSARADALGAVIRAEGGAPAAAAIVEAAVARASGRKAGADAPGR